MTNKQITLGEHYTWEVKECRLQFAPDLNKCFTLDAVKRKLLYDYPGWYVYRGGNHVALHRKDGDAERLLLIVEAEPGPIRDYPAPDQQGGAR